MFATINPGDKAALASEDLLMRAEIHLTTGYKISEIVRKVLEFGWEMSKIKFCLKKL
jgi:hypothetical protein